MQIENSILTYKEASEYLNIKLATLYGLVHEKRIPHFRLGARMVRFRQSELDRWMEEKYVEAKAMESHA